MAGGKRLYFGLDLVFYLDDTTLLKLAQLHCKNIVKNTAAILHKINVLYSDAIEFNCELSCSIKQLLNFKSTNSLLKWKKSYIKSMALCRFKTVNWDFIQADS